MIRLDPAPSRQKQDGLKYLVDTCYIDRTNSVELQIAINSMFASYRGSQRSILD